MASPRLAIATMTLARGAAEAALIERALGTLASGRAPVAVTDGGSASALVAAIGRLPGVSIGTSTHGPGLLGQVKTSLAAAAATGARRILYTEPDKQPFFAGGVDAFIEHAIELADAGIVLAARTPESYATFPAIQQYTEGVLNTLCGSYTGAPGDYSYGPFVMDAELVPRVLAIGEDVGWGWRPFIFAVAARLGMAVRVVPGDYPCPPDQRNEDDAERLHRIRQLQQNLRGLVLSQTVAV